MKPTIPLTCLIFCFTIFNFMEETSIGQDDSVDTSAMDRSVRIQDDLFQHVNGTWLKNTKIPEDKSNYGSFGILADQSQLRIKKIIEANSMGKHAAGTNEQKIADLYRSFMNAELVESKGFSPLEAELKKIKSLGTHEEVWEHLGYLSKIGVSSPVGFYVSQDPGQATQYICNLVQSGLSLPDRDYYLDQDEASAKSRKALEAYVQKLFEFAAIENSYLAAEEVFALEKQLAELSWPRTDLRDAKKRYNKMSFEELSNLTQGKLDWAKYFAAANVSKSPADVNVNTPSFFKGLVAVVEETSVDTWVRYLQYRLIDSYAGTLSKDFVHASFELYQKQLAGIPVQQPRWKRAVNTVAGQGAGDFGVLGEAVGELYVALHFKPEAKARMEELVNNLLKSFEGSINDLTWMTDETKAKAKAKLAKIGTKIGYPNVWRDYSQLEIKADDLFGNVYRSNIVEHNRNVGHLGKPIDREEWGMTPQTVNAYYSPTKNEIVFPAAILQAPFFSMKATDGLNYGGIGAVIGHEISHAFDDQGSRYDGDGNLNNWWSEKDESEFKKLTTQLVAQYAEYSPLEGKTINGNLTLGENIADLSGLSISHKALTMARQGKPEEVLLGWNSDQQFFVGWSRVWQRKYRDKEMIKRLLTDSHSPSQYRANGPVTNIEAFYKAFDVKAGDRLFKPVSERIKIW